MVNSKNFKLYFFTTLGFFFFRALHHGTTYEDTFIERTINDTWRLLYVVPLHYSLFEYAVPFIMRKRKHLVSNFLIGFLLVFVYSMLYSWGLSGWRHLGIGLNIYTSLLTKHFSPTALAGEQMAFSVMTLFFIGTARHIYLYYKLKQATQQLRIEKQQAELSFLKSQTNPHFLFNTLNNIYSLTRDKSDRAPESILRLSKILRFMLYETGGDYIPIEDEIKIIGDYIELEKLRYDDSLRIRFSHDVEEPRQSIPPLLLMPLVENAFKHGVSETRGQPYIDIRLSVNGRQLLFEVKNPSETAPAEVTENIGLSNLRRQLQLLYKDYDLTVHQGDGVFTAVLKINLTSHV
ncbi:MAG: histidine kinase [Chitinophagaceae bacterium]|jgi:sensor histidine kinase YesM|nr:histidine kinase [Chitinophagaceae bacterium]